MTKQYYDEIVDRLTGRVAELSGIPYERLDWQGLGSVLRLFHSTSGHDRAAMIHDLGRILETADQPPQVLADVLHLVSSLDLAEVEPSVQTLSGSPVAEMEPVKSALATYWAFRHVAAAPASSHNYASLPDQALG